jgi:hypothetical protein
MKNLAMNHSSSIFIDSGTLGLADPSGGEASDHASTVAQARTQTPGAAAQWWDSHPADLPQSTVLWIDADADAGSTSESSDNPTDQRAADPCAA